MYSLDYIRLQNFGSHKNSKFTPKDGITMIFGENLDDDGLKSNGSGKSHFYEAITKLVHNKTWKKVAKADLVRDGKDKALLTAEWSGTDHIKISREIKRKGSDVCTIWLNSIEQKQIVDKDKWIAEKFGVSFEDFVNYFVVGQRNAFSIFEAGDAYMKRMIARFTNTSFLDDIVKELKDESSEKKDERENLLGDLDRTNTRIDVLREQNKTLKETYLEELEEEYLEIGGNLKDLKAKKKSIIKNKNKYKERLDIKKTDMAEVDGGEVDRAKETTLKKSLKTTETDITHIERDKRHFEAVINGLLTCPNCGHEFSLDENLAKDKAETSLKEVEARLAEWETKREKRWKAWDKEKKKNDKLESTQESAEEKQEELDEYQEIYDNSITDLKGVKKQITEANNRSNEIEAIIADPENVDVPQIKANKKAIKRHKRDINKLNDDIAVLNDELENYEFWEVAFGNKGFKTHLINKTLGMVEGYTNYFLKKFKTSLRIRIDGFKENRDGTIQERITTHILRNGEDAGVYGKFSGGERRRIDICGVLAMRQIIYGNLRADQGINLLGMDELFEGLDDNGQSEILSMLEEINCPVFITTHLPVTKGGLVMDSLTVIKRNGISKIK